VVATAPNPTITPFRPQTKCVWRSWPRASLKQIALRRLWAVALKVFDPRFHGKRMDAHLPVALDPASSFTNGFVTPIFDLSCVRCRQSTRTPEAGQSK
jgi:hypothetical protein